MQRQFGVIFFLVIVIGTCCGQNDAPQIYSYRENEEAQIQDTDLSQNTPADASASLMLLLQAVFHDTSVCCDKDSAVGPDIRNPNPTSLKDVSERLKGRYPVTAGSWITLEARYLPQPSITAAAIVLPVLRNQRLLLQWHGRFYLLKGAKYDETVYTDGSSDYVIRQLMLLDPLSKAKDKEVIFDRQKDGWGNIEAILLLTAKRD